MVDWFRQWYGREQHAKFIAAVTMGLLMLLNISAIALIGLRLLPGGQNLIYKSGGQPGKTIYICVGVALMLLHWLLFPGTDIQKEAPSRQPNRRVALIYAITSITIFFSVSILLS
jgi:hypothetical protein